MENYRCPNCNTEVEEGEKICPKCGAKLYKTMNTSTVVILFIILGVLIFGFCRTFISCDKDTKTKEEDKYQKPKEMSDGVYNMGNNILECIDAYINGEETYKNTVEKFEEYEEDLKTRINDDVTVEQLISLDISIISAKLTLMDGYIGNIYTMDDLIDARNSLAETLNKPLYKK